METKFRVWDGKYMEEIDLYWFEENGVREVVDGVGKGHYGKVIVMQYTGPKDANGREVWEGDVLQYHDSTLVVILAAGGFNFDFIGKGYTLECNTVTASAARVIGNIYENPELLE